MSRQHWILKDGKPELAASLIEWAQWFETADRQIAFTTCVDGSDVSTVFLGLDHQFGEGPPILFESMVFFRRDGEFDEQERYSTMDEARRGHERMVKQCGGRAP